MNTIQAKYTPLNPAEIPELWLRARGKEFTFDFAYEVHGMKYYVTKELKFPTTNPIPETDLNEVKKCQTQ